MIVAPGVGLIVAGTLKLLGALKLVLLFGWGADWLNSFVPGLNVFSRWGELFVFDAAFKMIAGLLMLFGGYQMVRRQSYAWAIAAGIISIVACSLVGLPVGIWALIVLARQDVRQAFDFNGASGPASRQPKSFWGGFAVLIAGVLLLLAALGGVMFMAVRSMATWIGSPEVSAQTGLSAQDMQKAGINRDGREFRKEFSHSFPLSTNGQFSLDDINGRIEIQGWNSNLVVLNAVIHGSTAESVAAVKINMDSDPARVAVHTVLPSRTKDYSSFWDWLRDHTENANVDYTVRLPLRTHLENASTVNGSVVIDGMLDDIAASTVNGAIRVKDAERNLKLSTVNGSVSADMDKLGDGQSVALNTVNGGIRLALPDNAAATFSIAAVNGGISSDFPELDVKRQFPIGSNLSGSLHDGAASVRANTVNGGIEILKVGTASAN
jgi:hypothetical protein